MTGRKKRKYWISAFELTAVYLVVSVLYITFSSKIAAAVARDVDQLQQIETWKGNLFIIVTALLLFFYTRFMFKRESRHLHELHVHRMALLAAEQRGISSQMARAIGHDINNILAIISFNIELIEKTLNGHDGSEKLVTTLDNATKRLYFLAQRLRDAGWEVADQELTELNVRAVIDDAVELAKMVQAQITSTVKVDCPADLIMRGCEPVLHQAIFNMLLNAMDAAALEPCIIEVSAKRMDDVVTIEIHDNGPGIPEGKETTIFDMFYTTKEKGTGIGLLSARVCAQLHHGDLTICESRLGGACFCLELSAESTENGLGHNYAI